MIVSSSYHEAQRIHVCQSGNPFDQKSTESHISSKSNRRWAVIVCDAIVHHCPFVVCSKHCVGQTKWMRKKSKCEKKTNVSPSKTVSMAPVYQMNYKCSVCVHRITRPTEAPIQALSCVFCSLSVHFYCLNSSYVCLCKSMFTTSINVAPQLCPILPYLIVVVVVYFHYLCLLCPLHSLPLSLSPTLGASLCHVIKYTLHYTSRNLFRLLIAVRFIVFTSWRHALCACAFISISDT